MTTYTTRVSIRESNVDMQGPRIIVAGKNPVQRARMARMLSDERIPIETNGSAACLMEKLLHGGTSIVVLIDRLEEGLGFAHLIPLLKSCSSRSTLILATDEVSPAEELSIRQQGVFYRTNQPDCAEGWDELQLAVDCACNSVMYAVRPFHPRDAGNGYKQPL